MTNYPEIITLDLNFQNCPNAIASYLIPYQEGLILIESGPGSTQNELVRNLRELDYSLEDITHVLLTHIHLDHAGAAGWLAEQSGARVYVNHRGAPHMLDPSRLLASAARIYQEKMDQLWGDFLPVPEKQLVILEDGMEIQIGSYIFKALDTPGHANHHMAYILDEICFSGDVGGVRIGSSGKQHLRLPMPPPEFHPPRWRESIAKLKKEKITRIAPTHFGVFDDVEWHIDSVLSEIDAAEEWMQKIMPRDLPIEDLRTEFLIWVRNRSLELEIAEVTLDAFEKANPSGMSADGMKRYWDKYIDPQ
ncbi:MAG: MBL fold metallo-hydrolase [Chloroflexota bacterium]|nr:MAG: MBL fold metallo-hydrolase [Chloroflexota bacterium]